MRAVLSQMLPQVYEAVPRIIGAVLVLVVGMVVAAVIGSMVRRLLAEGRDFSDLTPDEWRAASEFFGDDAPRAATALASVEAKRTPQSTNPEAVRRALDECRQWVAGAAEMR